VGNLEEIIDENHAIVSSNVGPEYYVGITSFVDKAQLEPGSTVLMHNKALTVVGILQVRRSRARGAAAPGWDGRAPGRTRGAGRRARRCVDS